MVETGHLVLLVGMAGTVFQGEMARREKEERGESQAFRVPQGPVVPPLVGWSTPGGGGPPAQTQQELNWSTLGG